MSTLALFCGAAALASAQAPVVHMNNGTLYSSSQGLVESSHAAAAAQQARDSAFQSSVQSSVNSLTSGAGNGNSSASGGGVWTAHGYDQGNANGASDGSVPTSGGNDFASVYRRLQDRAANGDEGAINALARYDEQQVRASQQQSPPDAESMTPSQQAAQARAQRQADEAKYRAENPTPAQAAAQARAEAKAAAIQARAEAKAAAEEAKAANRDSSIAMSEYKSGRNRATERTDVALKAELAGSSQQIQDYWSPGDSKKARAEGIDWGDYDRRVEEWKTSLDALAEKVADVSTSRSSRPTMSKDGKVITREQQAQISDNDYLKLIKSPHAKY